VRLPVIRSARGELIGAMLTVAVCAPMYFIPQHWSFAEAVELPLTALDRAIPFWPASALLYYGTFVFLVVAFLAQRDREQRTRFLYANVLAQIAGMLIFVFWPTRYPRELFPLPAADTLGSSMMGFMRAMDTPVNCLPSLHVCTTTLCVLALAGSRWFGAAVAAGLLMAASTLTVKQHYVVDVLAGVAQGAAAWWICFRWRGLRLGQATSAPAP
jgi:membrane-associated phospholipid phosphatase